MHSVTVFYCTFSNTNFSQRHHLPSLQITTFLKRSLYFFPFKIYSFSPLTVWAQSQGWRNPRLHHRSAAASAAVKHSCTVGYHLSASKPSYWVAIIFSTSQFTAWTKPKDKARHKSQTSNLLCCNPARLKMKTLCYQEEQTHWCFPEVLNTHFPALEE